MSRGEEHRIFTDAMDSHIRAELSDISIDCQSLKFGGIHIHFEKASQDQFRICQTLNASRDYNQQQLDFQRESILNGCSRGDFTFESIDGDKIKISHGGNKGVKGVIDREAFVNFLDNLS